MHYPTLRHLAVTRLMTETFRGYHHALKLRDGEFYETRNLSTEDYPLLTVRKAASKLPIVQHAAQGMIAKDALAWVDNGTLWYNGQPTAVTALSPGDKQLVGMGAYIVIFPDKVYFNTADASDHGSLEAHWRYTGPVRYTMCDSTGKEYEHVTVQALAPDAPEGGELWLDSAGRQLKQYDTVTAMWITVQTVFTKLSFTTQGQLKRLFGEHDGVTLAGAALEDLNGSKVLYALGGEEGRENDWLVVVGIAAETVENPEDTITIDRTVPTLDFVCECRNRLWGCYYGSDGERNLNELYCCALGDFKNWNQFLGLSTDSWRASVGSDGVWTGCINYLGSPTFFKEERIHTITPSREGAHQVAELPARGVQQGSSRSLAIVGETLYYKARSEVCAYQGGFPGGVSDALGDERYSDAVGGAFGSNYWLSMRSAQGEWQLFCLDTARALWMHVNDTHVRQFEAIDDSLLALIGDELWDLNGEAEGERESAREWLAESGILYCQYPDSKYLSRYNLRLRAESGATICMEVEYDSSGVWESAGRFTPSGTGTVTLPVQPRRCDHMRLRLSGRGDVKLFSVTRILEKGSDV